MPDLRSSTSTTGSRNRVRDAARGERPLARRDGRTLRRQPLDDLADRARREQPDRGRAGEDRHRPGRPARLAVRRAGALRPSPVARGATSRPPWRDPAVGLRAAQRVAAAVRPRRSRSSRCRFPPGARVAYETGARESRIHQQVWVLEGAIDVTAGRRDASAARGRLPGHACSIARPRSTTARARPARYAVVIATELAREEMTMSDSTVTHRFRFDAWIA